MRQLYPRPLLVAAMAAMAGLAACGGDSPTENKNPAIALTVSGQSMTVAQGAAHTLVATVVRTDFDGAVTLSATGAPSGVQVSFQPASLASGVATSTITFTAAATAAVGTHTVKITAAGAGLDAKSVDVALTITATGGFSLSVAPATVSMVQGAGATSTVNIARTGSFTDAVALTVTGLPAGMSAGFTPASATGATATLALTAAASTPVGTHTLTIRGNAAGQGEQTVTLAATVTAAPAGTQISISFCANELPNWLAYQNDGGAWTQVTGTGGTYTFTATTTKIGFAVTFVETPEAGSQPDAETFVMYSTAAELKAMVTSELQDCSSGDGKTLSGSATGISAGQFAQFHLGWSYASLGAPGTYQMTNVRDGALDLVAIRSTVGTTGNMVPDKLVVHRNLNLASGGTIPAVDFNGTGAVTPASATLTVTGAGSDTTYSFAGVQTANGTFAGLSYGEGSGPMYGFPASLVQSGDKHFASAYAYNDNGSRSVSSFHAQLASRTLALGPAAASPTVTTISGTTPVRLRLTVPVQADYAGMVEVEFGSGNGFGIVMTAAYRGSATSWVIEVPDFGSASGFNSAWGLQTGAAYEWYMDAASHGWWTHETAPAEGLVVKSASRWSGSATTPMISGETGGERPQRRTMTSERLFRR